MNFSQLAAGTIIDGKYELLEFVNSGGWSIVYKAKHLALDQLVAVKILHWHLSNDEEKIKRFAQEAKAASQLNHPSVIRVLDYGFLPSQQPYLVMEYLEGEDLAVILKREQRIEAEKVIEIFSQICGGLAVSHDKGIVHRDLKPSNIMLVHEKEAPPVVKLVDFGIAKTMSEMEKEHLTRTGETVGTPTYMSPEQCMGRPLDARSDIYSLGCVLYECLTGKPIYESTVTPEVMHKHVYDMPAPFSEACPGQRIPTRLEEVVFKALAKEPEHRYQSALELKKDLDGLSSGSDIWKSTFSGRLGKFRRQVRRTWQRSRKFVAAAAAFVVIGTFYSLYVQPFYWEMTFTSQIHKGDDYLGKEDYPNAQKEFEHALHSAKQVPNQKSLQISAMRRLMIPLEKEGRWEEVESYREQIAAIERQVQKNELGEDPVNASNQDDLPGLAAAQLKGMPTAVDKFQPVDFYLEWADKLQATAYLCMRQGLPVEGEKLMRGALKLQEGVGSPGRPGLGRIVANLGIALAMQRKYDEAEEYLVRSIELGREFPGANSSILVNSMCNLGRLKLSTREYKQSEAIYKEALDISYAQPQETRALALCLEDYAALCRSLGRSEEAAKFSAEAKGVRDRVEPKAITQ
jgi:serine/threonine protein kinase